MTYPCSRHNASLANLCRRGFVEKNADYEIDYIMFMNYREESKSTIDMISSDKKRRN